MTYEKRRAKKGSGITPVDFSKSHRKLQTKGGRIEPGTHNKN